mmetsp:Transcript_6274/g.28730  ORF Transcript_6274/g.28730 Transcript_6274/m.28730 type:complete len:244 (-) Transcript_6274:7-738(-)
MYVNPPRDPSLRPSRVVHVVLAPQPGGHRLAIQPRRVRGLHVPVVQDGVVAPVQPAGRRHPPELGAVVGRIVLRDGVLLSVQQPLGGTARGGERARGRGVWCRAGRHRRHNLQQGRVGIVVFRPVPRRGHLRHARRRVDVRVVHLLDASLGDHRVQPVRVVVHRRAEVTRVGPPVPRRVPVEVLVRVDPLLHQRVAPQLGLELVGAGLVVAHGRRLDGPVQDAVLLEQHGALNPRAPLVPALG